MTRILCDCDGVFFDFAGAMLAWLKQRGVSYELSDISVYPGYNAFAPIHKAMVLEQIPGDRQFCKDIPLYPGAQAFLAKVVEHADQVRLVTAPFPGAYWKQQREEAIDSLLSPKWGSKVDWLFAHDERVQMPYDVLLEDRLDTALAWAKTGRQAILFDYPWNQCENLDRRVTRVRSYADALQAIWPGISI